jgi:hypothetical protein
MWLLLTQRKVKRVDYPTDIAIGDCLHLSAWLGHDEALPIAPEEFEMPAEIITQANEMLASFALTSGEIPAIPFCTPRSNP